MLLPFYYRTSIKTNLSEEQVINILYENTITSKGKTFKDKRTAARVLHKAEGYTETYLYKAKLRHHKFRIFRMLQTSAGPAPRNSFNPLCYGDIFQKADFCEIKLTIRSAIFVLMFMFIWTSGLIFGTIGISVQSIQKGKYIDAFLTPIVLSPFYLIFWLFYKFGFKREVNRTLSFLNSIGLRNSIKV